MKIAYLITAHKDAKQLNRLIRSLDNGKNEFFIHVPVYVDLSPFIDAVGENVKIHWCKKREWTNWGGASQVYAKFNLLEEALSYAADFDRFVYLSGMDYPIMSNKKIEEEFISNPQKEYIIGYDLSVSGSEKMKWKLKKLHFYDFKIKNRLLYRIVRKLYMYMTVMIYKFGIRFNTFYKDSNGKVCHIYFGSEFVALTAGAANEIYNYIKKESNLLKRLKHSFAPSELFLQTAFFNTKYKKYGTIIIDNNGDNKLWELINLSDITYFDYSNGIINFDESRFDELMRCNKIFIRKVISGFSNELISMIDKKRAS